MRSKPWAYPPGIPESGVGWFEVTMGVAAFLLLGLSAAQGFRQAGMAHCEAGAGRPLTRAGSAQELSAMAGPAGPGFRRNGGGRDIAPDSQGGRP